MLGKNSCNSKGFLFCWVSACWGCRVLANAVWADPVESQKSVKMWYWLVLEIYFQKGRAVQCLVRTLSAKIHSEIESKDSANNLQINWNHYNLENVLQIYTASRVHTDAALSATHWQRSCAIFDCILKQSLSFWQISVNALTSKTLHCHWIGKVGLNMAHNSKMPSVWIWTSNLPIADGNLGQWLCCFGSHL